MLLRRCFVAVPFKICWVLCPSVAHNAILQTSLLHIVTSCYSSLARCRILIFLCLQSPLPNPCLIPGFISKPFCQELHFCSSLQCLLHVFIVLILISVTSLSQQPYIQRQRLHSPVTIITFPRFLPSGTNKAWSNSQLWLPSLPKIKEKK